MTNAIRVHHATVDPQTKQFTRKDDLLRMDDEPGHQDLCEREQIAFHQAIVKDEDLSEMMDAAVNSLKIVLAADESIRTQQVIALG